MGAKTSVPSGTSRSLCAVEGPLLWLEAPRAPGPCPREHHFTGTGLPPGVFLWLWASPGPCPPCHGHHGPKPRGVPFLAALAPVAVLSFFLLASGVSYPRQRGAGLKDGDSRTSSEPSSRSPPLPREQRQLYYRGQRARHGACPRRDIVRRDASLAVAAGPLSTGLVVAQAVAKPLARLWAPWPPCCGTPSARPVMDCPSQGAASGRLPRSGFRRRPPSLPCSGGRRVEESALVRCFHSLPCAARPVQVAAASDHEAMLTFFVLSCIGARGVRTPSLDVHVTGGAAHLVSALWAPFAAPSATRWSAGSASEAAFGRSSRHASWRPPSPSPSAPSPTSSR